jgi:hypothetical protein
LQRALGSQRLTAKRQTETVDFMEWARHYVDQLDALCTSPHDPDMKSERPSYYTPPETKLNEVLARLLGQRWEEAFKLGAPEETQLERTAASDPFGDDDELELDEA